MDKWLNEIEAFSLRSERLYEDFPEVKDKEKLLKWLEAAYNVGYKDGLKFSDVTRLEVIGPEGREYVRYFEDEEFMHYMLQDEDRTLKIFIEDCK